MKPRLYNNGDICDNIKETRSFSIGFPKCDHIDNEGVAYVHEDREGMYVQDDTIIDKKKKMT